ncbi:acetyl/propionyl/methylcrotonyl-CoA carboxylase subunit alpha [Alphaproteobacteria bacterium]|nr:acetyl/propionyl/methylcrotonyl-CoA carboxylase subunit alpha [Alphaproteobacteria bacterium]
MFKKILIANRGEIACRVIKTARKMNIKTVAVYSDADRYSEHVRLADEAFHLGASSASESYLRSDLIIKACKETNCDALHPGYGFLSENANFVGELNKAGIIFIGPSRSAIASMGDKIESKKIAQSANVNTVPGHIGIIKDKTEAIKIADEIGYPVIIKASAGGGGKGMRIAFSKDEVSDSFERAESEALNSFGDKRIFIEKFITEPRHIEIQILADNYGNIVYLGERECSIQRRNQKVIEEAPSPFLDEQTRKKMGDQAVQLSRKVSYSSAGTVEFIVDKEKNFYFLEMNTRLQVEHPVTELITEIDLVEQMINIAFGEKLDIAQKDVKLNGSAIETRIYAENPYKNFLPSIGRLTKYNPPKEKKYPDGSIIRNDTGVREGDEVSMFYDPMIAKLCSWGETRDISIKRMESALDNFLLEGIDHNIPFLSAILGSKRFKSADLSTSFIQEEYEEGFQGIIPNKQEEWTLGTIILAYHITEILKDFDSLEGFSEEWQVHIKYKSLLSDISKLNFKIKKQVGDEIRLLIQPIASKKILGIANEYLIFDIQKDFITKLVSASIKLFCDNNNEISFPEKIQCRINYQNPSLDLLYRGISISATVLPRHIAEHHKYMKPIKIVDKSNFLLCPMPGKLIRVLVKENDIVDEGQPLCVVEAMKMENTLIASKKCMVNKINHEEGATLSVDQIIMEFIFK